MKTINSSDILSELSIRDTPVMGAIISDSEERQPCWYVNVNKNGGNPEDYSWKVGVSGVVGGEENEFEFTLSDMTKSPSKIWSTVNTPGFPIRLLDKYRDGGRKAVKEWFKNGCP